MRLNNEKSFDVTLYENPLVFIRAKNLVVMNNNANQCIYVKRNNVLIPILIVNNSSIKLKSMNEQMKYPLTKKGATKHDVLSLGKNLGPSLSLRARKSAVLVHYVEIELCRNSCFL